MRRGCILFNVLLLTICIMCLARVGRQFSISGCALLAIARCVWFLGVWFCRI